MPKLLQTLGKYEAATKISTFGGKNYQLLSKDFGKGLSEGSLGGILQKIEKQASEWGLNTRFELNNEGDAIKLGFYDAYKNPFDEKGNYQWDQGFSTTLGLAQKDGTIRVGNQKKANFMNIYNDKQRGMTLQTLQEAQAVKILNAFMNDNSKLKALVLGETSDYEEATRYLARVRNTALDNAPNSGSYINSAMEEADKSTNAGNIEQNVTRMQSIQMGAYFKNKIREYLKGQADATTKRQEHFEDVDYNNIEGMLNNRLKQVSQSLIMTASGIEGRKIVLGTPEFRWIEKSGIMNDIDAISQLGFKFGPNNEEAALTGIIGMGGSSTFDAFNVLQPDWHRASEQTKNRAKMKAKKGSLIDNKTVFENIMGSDIGSALGINYNDESYGQQVFAETSDKIIMQAYKNIFKKHNPKKTDQEIEKMLENEILPSVHNDSAIIRDSALKNKQVLTKSSNTLSMDDAKKYFKDTLFSALEDKDSIKDWENIEKYVTNEGRKYLDNFQIDQMYFSDGQLIISKSRWDDLKSGFKGLGEHGSRKTWQGINQGVISDEIFNEIARLSGLGENAYDITGFYEKPKNDRKNSLQSVGGRYQYLLTKFFNGDKGFKGLSEDDKKAKISKFQDAIKDLPVLSKMLEWDPINEKIQRKKDFKESSVSEDDWTNFLDVWNKDSEWEKLDEALFGSEGRENRRGRMAESLGQMKEYEWFSPTGTGGTAYSHTSMTKKGVDAMNRAMNFVNALKKGNSTVSTLQKLMNNYYIPEQSQNLLATLPLLS